VGFGLVRGTQYLSLRYIISFVVIYAMGLPFGVDNVVIVAT